jgi:hypothetical protein
MDCGKMGKLTGAMKKNQLFILPVIPLLRFWKLVNSWRIEGEYTCVYIPLPFLHLLWREGG